MRNAECGMRNAEFLSFDRQSEIAKCGNEIVESLHSAFRIPHSINHCDPLRTPFLKTNAPLG
jgi:hypothetical protein